MSPFSLFKTHFSRLVILMAADSEKGRSSCFMRGFFFFPFVRATVDLLCFTASRTLFGLICRQTEGVTAGGNDGPFISVYLFCEKQNK